METASKEEHVTVH